MITETQNNAKKVEVTGKVTKVSKPKQYQYGPKFFMQVDSEKRGTIKVMVSLESLINPSRETPFVGDKVKITAKKIDAKGWMNVLPSDTYKIIDDSGKEIHNLAICRNKLEIIKKHMIDLHKNELVTPEQLDTFEKMTEEIEANSFSFKHQSPSISSLSKRVSVGTKRCEKCGLPIDWCVCEEIKNGEM